MLYFKYIPLYIYILLLIGLKNSIAQQVNNQQFGSYKNISSTNVAIEQCWKLRKINQKKAISYCNKALYDLRNNQMDREWCKLLNYTGVVQLYLGNMDSAYFYFQKALNNAFIINSDIEMAFAYNNFGDYYIENSNYLLATENILKSYKIFNKQNNKQGIAYNLVNLSEIYVKQNKYEIALDTLASALKIRESLKDFRKIAITQRKIILIHLLKNELDSAEVILNKAFNKNPANESPFAKANYVDLLSRIFYERKVYDTALELRIESINLNRELNNKKDESIDLSKLGEIYFSINDFSKAEKVIIQSQQIAKSINHKEIELNNYLTLSKVYKAKKDDSNAFIFLEKYVQLNDSINTKLSKNSILNLEQAYRQEKADAEKKLLDKQLVYEFSSKRNIISFSLLLFFLSLYLMYEILTKRIANKRLKASNNAKDRFFSILSHDIMGPISNIKLISDLLTVDAEKIIDNKQKSIIENLKYSVDNLIELINRIIEWSRATTGRTQYNPVNFTINTEIENVLSSAKDSTSAKNQNLINKVKENHLVYADQEMINTILRNLLANAIKFTPKNGSIQLSTFKKNNKIQVLIEDTGVGMTKQTINKIIYKNEISSTIGTNKEKGTGLGLSICKELIKINKGKFWIESEPGKGSKFYFSLPTTNY